MGSPFDTPVTTPQPTPFQNIMGALGVTWGKNQNVAAQDAAALEKDRLAKQQASVWGPLYKVTSDVVAKNPQWGMDKVMLSVMQSPEWLNAASTPNFDHANAGKNLLETVKSFYPMTPNLQTVGTNQTLLAQQPQGSANAGAISEVARGPQETEYTNSAGEVYQKERTPGGITDPTGGMGGAGTGVVAQPTGIQPPPGVPNAPPPQHTYSTPDGSDSPEPVVPWLKSIREMPPELAAAADEAGFQNGIPGDAMASLLWQESRWKPNAIGRPLKDGDRAYGIGQIKGNTWNKEIAPELGFAPTDINDPVKNIQGSAYYLGKLLRKYKGDYQTALMAYNWGQGNVDKWDGDWNKVPDETIDYVSDITNGTANIPRVSKSGSNSSARRTIRAELPADRPANMDDVAKMVGENKQFMFLGSGGIPWLKDLITRSARTLDPSLVNDQEWAVAAQANRSNLAYLQWTISKLNRAGDNRLAVLAEKALAMFPEGVVEDPFAANEAAINLYNNLSTQYYRNQQVTMKNANSQAVKDAQNENLRIMDVLHAMPTLSQMLDMRKLMKSSDIVQGPKGAISDVSKLLGPTLKYAGDTVREVAGSNPPGIATGGKGGVVQTTGPSSNGPTVKNVVRGPDGKLILGQ